MERMEGSERDDAQKAKLIFLVLTAVVTALLIWSLVSANSARKERDQARQEIDALKQDNAKLELLLRDQNQMIDDLKKKVSVLEAKAKAKPAKKKTTAKKSAKKTSKTKKGSH